MIRRWLIRLPFLLALAFVVGAWVMSYFAGFTYFWNLGGRCWQLGSAQGLGYVSVARSEFSNHFEFGRGDSSTHWFGGHPTLGFSIESGDGIGIHNLGGSDSLGVIFPLWLPTLVLSGLTWFVWRKTRPKQVGRAFPVEPTVKSK